ncbi:MAG: hypothetical protein U1E05_24660, partial [Patescibacteria group bacterium]|nr:hypothetical protein [Patescibacteria group bacterium]
RDTEAALRQAETEFPVDMEAIQADYRAAVAEWVASRKLADEALFAPILRPADADTRGAMGVVMEPTWRMNESSLGFHQRVLAVAACRTLADAGQAYATLDVRDLEHAALNPRQTPTVLFIADRLRSYAGIDAKRIEANLAAYRAAGGRLLWIGEHVPPTVFPELAAPAGTLPKQWPAEPAEVPACTLSLAAPGTGSWTMLRNPHTPAGWQRPACPTIRAADPARGVAPLVEFSAGDERAVVGVLIQGRGLGDGAALGKAAVLPTLAIHPYLFDNPDVDKSPADLRLDAAGRAVLLDTVERIEKE